MLRVVRPAPSAPLARRLLAMNSALIADWLVAFLRDECVRRRKVTHAVVGLSGGVDSAVTAYLCARAFGPQNVHTVRMPYKVSSPESLTHAQLVVDDLGLDDRTVEITQMVDGYVATAEPDMDGTRLGNVCARCRMTVLFDQSAKFRGLPIGTGNKTERFFGYFTWHADDAPPINPLGDLFKTQVWALARELGVPSVIVDKPPTADLVKGQTDEGDFGISYQLADEILVLLLHGLSPEDVAAQGYRPEDVETVRSRVARTHWKRHLPTVAMLSETAINEFYLRPVDF
ncbi:MAG: NAD+ synthase [Fimbriimonadaceae bacterium]|nr:NAD+ synthase [Fimbriimonadaceae bacterium]